MDSYGEALALVKRFPDSSQAHFALSYVLRYAGLLEEAARECDKALALDSSDSRLRSCAWPFAWLGQYQKAMRFLELDRGSEWVTRVTPYMLVAQGKQAEARESINKAPPDTFFAFGADVWQACLDASQANRLERAAKNFESAVMAQPDSERRYIGGILLAYCGQEDAATRTMASAIKDNYCAYTALQHDSLLAKLRESPEYHQLLSAAKACQDYFLSKRGGSRP